MVVGILINTHREVIVLGRLVINHHIELHILYVPESKFPDIVIQHEHLPCCHHGQVQGIQDNIKQCRIRFIPGRYRVAGILQCTCLQIEVPGNHLDDLTCCLILIIVAVLVLKVPELVIGRNLDFSISAPAPLKDESEEYRFPVHVQPDGVPLFDF